MAKKKPKKTARKTAQRTRQQKPATPTLIEHPNANGGALLSGGVPGNKGGPGRPPKAFKQFCTDLVKDPTFQTNLEATAKDAKSPHYMGAVKLAAAYAEGLPPQAINLAGEITFNTDELRQRLADRVARHAVKKRTR